MRGFALFPLLSLCFAAPLASPGNSPSTASNKAAQKEIHRASWEEYKIIRKEFDIRFDKYNPGPRDPSKVLDDYDFCGKQWPILAAKADQMEKMKHTSKDELWQIRFTATQMEDFTNMRMSKLISETDFEKDTEAKLKGRMESEHSYFLAGHHKTYKDNLSWRRNAQRHNEPNEVIRDFNRQIFVARGYLDAYNKVYGDTGFVDHPYSEEYLNNLARSFAL